MPRRPSVGQLIQYITTPFISQAFLHTFLKNFSNIFSNSTRLVLYLVFRSFIFLIIYTRYIRYEYRASIFAVVQTLAFCFLRWYNISVMRIDKFLKVSRIIKRRTVAAEACDAGKVYVNGKSVKPAHTLKIGDVIEIKLGTTPIKVKVASLNDKAAKNDVSSLYETV